LVIFCHSFLLVVIGRCRVNKRYSDILILFHLRFLCRLDYYSWHQRMKSSSSSMTKAWTTSRIFSSCSGKHLTTILPSLGTMGLTFALILVSLSPCISLYYPSSSCIQVQVVTQVNNLERTQTVHQTMTKENGIIWFLGVHQKHNPHLL